MIVWIWITIDTVNLNSGYFKLRIHQSFNTLVEGSLLPILQQNMLHKWIHWTFNIKVYTKSNLPAVRLLNIPWLRWADLNELLGTRISPCFKNGIAKLATQGRLRFYLKNLNWQLFFGGKKTLSCRPSTESTRTPFALCRPSMSLHPPQQTYKPSRRLKQWERPQESKTPNHQPWHHLAT